MYTDKELDAICRAREVLQQAGLRPEDILANNISTNMSSLSILPLINYIPPQATLFTPDELNAQKGRLTRKTHIHAIVDHPVGAIVEYPETGDEDNVAICHRFMVPPGEFAHPKFNIQYSLGRDHSMHRVQCWLLCDKDTGEAVPCEQIKISCGSLKKCSFNPATSLRETPEFVAMPLNASGELFMKTLGFFCALLELGCPFPRQSCNNSNNDANDDDASEEEEDFGLGLGRRVPVADFVSVLKDARSIRDKQILNCGGKLVFATDKYGHHFIRCEHYMKGRRSHLRLRNLNEMDTGYLEALVNNDLERILSYERAAAREGYGPLAPCDIFAAPREQKELCPMWHRDAQGILRRGNMEAAGNCPCRFEIYTPYNLTQCPYILIVSRNPHSHSNPPRTKTPAAIEDIFNSLLEPLGWRLADATPRRLLLDNAFIQSLRQILGWTDFRDPGLGDLHPSLVNYDHAARLINRLRLKRYPAGTGLEGAKKLLKQHSLLRPEDQYIRCVDTHELGKEGKFYIVVCMFKAMSHLLLKTKRLSIDTSFKRLHNWQEFEIEAWFPEYSRSVVVARAFTTSQSAKAHHILFRTIFDIVKMDTGHAVQFRHIHGDGFDTITADGHRGQAIGLGLYCQELCKSMKKRSIEWKKPLNKLTPTEHLGCLFRACFTHYTRNVSNLRGQVKESILSAMMSLASSDALPNYDKVIKTIRSGGKKASDWLDDKEANGGYMLAGIYRPKSKIPLEIWKAAPSTSNGNEQAHRNINRDGTKLTMLAGIMRGLQFDSRAMKNIAFLIDESVSSRDRLSTHFRRSAKAVRYKATAQHKIVLGKDVEIQNLCFKAKGLQDDIISAAASLKHALDLSEDPTPAQKRLKQCDDQLQNTRKQLETLLPQGSGLFPLNEGEKYSEILYDRRLLDIKHEEKPAVPPSAFHEPVQPSSPAPAYTSMYASVQSSSSTLHATSSTMVPEQVHSYDPTPATSHLEQPHCHLCAMSSTTAYLEDQYLHASTSGATVHLQQPYVYTPTMQNTSIAQVGVDTSLFNQPAPTSGHYSTVQSYYPDYPPNDNTQFNHNNQFPMLQFDNSYFSHP